MAVDEATLAAATAAAAEQKAAGTRRQGKHTWLAAAADHPRPLLSCAVACMWTLEQCSAHASRIALDSRVWCSKILYSTVCKILVGYGCGAPVQSGPCPSEQPAATSAGDKSLMVYDRAITVLKAWHSLALWPWPIGWPSLEETRSYWAVIGQQQNVAVFASSRTLLALFAAWHFRCHGRLPL